MAIIDSQVHVYEANTSKRPWHNVPNWPAARHRRRDGRGDGQVGVDGAIFISAFSMSYDASYAVEVQQAHPDRFAIIKPVNPDDPAVAEIIADWKKIRHGRHPHHADQGSEPRAGRPGPRPDLPRRRAARFPGQRAVLGRCRAGTALVDRHPDTRFIIDHMAILQPRVPPAPPQPWADLPKVLELAKRKNAVIKVSGACTLSQQPYPFPDIGTRWPACSTPGASTAACGAPIGRVLRGRQLRTGGRAVPSNRPAERQREGNADGRRYRQGLWLVSEESVVPPRGSIGATRRRRRICVAVGRAGVDRITQPHLKQTDPGALLPARYEPPTARPGRGSRTRRCRGGNGARGSR